MRLLRQDFSTLGEPQSLIFDLLATKRAPLHPLNQVPEEVWSRALAIAAEQRLMPLLYHRIQQRSLSLSVPPQVLVQLLDAYRRSAGRALQHQAMVMDMARHLGEWSIPFVVLKGAWLAWQVYPEPALRPMRDVDVLVARDRAVQVFSLFLERGYRQVDRLAVPLEKLLDTEKHLPPLAHPTTGRVVEIHGHLLIPDPAQTVPAIFTDFSLLLATSQEWNLAGTMVRSPDSTVALLHLIVHAIDDHFFNNGPLAIEDVHRILRTCAIDWPRFWDMARQGGWVRSAGLMFDLVNQLHGPHAIERPSGDCPPVPAQIASAAAVLTMQPYAARAAFSLSRGLALAPGRAARLRYLLGRAFPSRYVLAEIARIPATSRRLPFFYPVWLYRTATKLIAGQGNASAGAGETYAVSDWLRGQAVSSSKDRSHVLSSPFSRITNFMQRPAAERTLLLQAMALFVAYRTITRVLGKKRQTRLFGHAIPLADASARAQACKLDAGQQTIVRAVQRAMDRTATIMRLRDSCLIEALVARRLLRARGIPTFMYLGVMIGRPLRDGESHVWLDAGPIPITGYPEMHDYQPCTAFLDAT